MSYLDYKEEFEEIYTTYINRDGADKLLDYLEKSDFFVAPASMRRHCSYEGGLCDHSIHVYKRMLRLVEAEYGENWQDTVSHESVAIMALLHDLCKIDTYVKDFRNVKVDGVWTKVPCYKTEEALPYGHGEKSVYIISAFLRLTREEALAINWHMGEYDARVKGGSYAMADAYYKYPICLLLHLADLTATYLDEKSDGSEVQ